MNETQMKERESISSKINWFMYYQVKRRIRNAGLWIIWKLPKRVVYWCVIRAAVQADPIGPPADVTAEQMLREFDY